MMRFLCDVHIPYRLVAHLESLGYTSTHVNKMQDRWHTTDAAICSWADANDYVAVTKDTDFKDSFFVNRTPKKLIKINLGNIPNDDLIQIFTQSQNLFETISTLESFLIEMDKDDIRLTEVKI